MKLTVIPADGYIIVDGVLAQGITMPPSMEFVHAVQWDGDSGEIEVVASKEGKPSNIPITDFRELQWALDLWTEARDRELSTPPPVVNVSVVTMRQAKLALYNAGLLDAVNAAVAAAGGAAAIEWEYATQVERTWPLVVQLASVLKFSDEQLDDLFAVAAQL